MRATRRRDRLQRGLALVGLLALWWGIAGCGDNNKISPEEAERIQAVFAQGLKDSDPYVRAETVRVMGLVRSPELIPLLERAHQDKDPMVRAGALIQLSRLKPAEILPELTELLTKSDVKTSTEVFGGVLAIMPQGETRNKAIELALRHDNPATRRKALWFGIQPAVGMIKDQDRRELWLFPVLSRLVDDPDPIIAGGALRLLEGLGKGDRVNPILEEAASASEDKRRRAIRVLAEAANTKHLGFLKDLAKSIPDSLKGDIAIARVASGDKEALDGVREALTGAGEEVLIMAFRALRHCDSADSYRLMRSYRSDSRAEVRSQMYLLMGEHPAASGQDFKKGMRDEEPEVILAAVRGLIRSEARYFGLLLGDDLKNKHRTLDSLVAVLSAMDQMQEQGDLKALQTLQGELYQVKPRLIELTSDPDPRIRGGAAELLFWNEKPAEIFAALKDPSQEVIYAWLNHAAQNIPPDNPRRDLELFARYSAQGSPPQILIGSAGIWAIYQQLQTQNPEPSDPEG